MRFQIKTTLFLPGLLLLLTLQGCGGCGFNCGGTTSQSAQLSLGFSGSASNDIKSVTVTVDAITFRRAGKDDVVVNNFTIDKLSITNAETFQVDLLSYPGLKQLLVIKNLKFEKGNYTDIILTIIDNDVNRSFVKDSADNVKALNISGDTLTIGGININSNNQTFTAKFSLSQSLFFQSTTDDYRLTTKGIRLLDNATDASLAGTINTSLFDQTAPCDQKTDPQKGNRLYLYKGKNLVAANLADVHSSNSNPAAPANAIKPFEVAIASETAAGQWEYVLAYLPSGDYTLAFTCNAVTDDPVQFDGFDIPLPTAQLYEITLDNAEASTCNIEANANCQ